jgi:hypothetical protein
MFYLRTHYELTGKINIKMSLLLIQINGKCEVPIQIISLR